MTHAEVVIARRAVEEGRGLVIVVNKMDCLRGKQKSMLYQKVKEAVPQEIQTVLPQVGHFISMSLPILSASCPLSKGQVQRQGLLS